jgi:hypothetical protein
MTEERIPLDMVAVTRQALGLREWWLEYDCHGAPFTWRGQAANESAADTVARGALQSVAGFNGAEATLTVCIEC